MEKDERITINPKVMGGKPCIRGMRITVNTVAGLIASGVSAEEILNMYPYLEGNDITAVLNYTSLPNDEEYVP